MALFTESLNALNVASHAPEHRNAKNRFLGWYANHDGEMLGFVFSASLRVYKEYYKQCSDDFKTLTPSLRVNMRDQAQGNFAHASMGNGQLPKMTFRRSH